jgi:predicted nucleic acid-binding protein
MPDIDKAVIFDTSALIEEITAGEKASFVEEIWKDTSFSVEVPTLVLAELVSVLRRKGINPTEVRERIITSCIILPLTEKVALDAGELHAQLRKKDSGISLADCIVMAHAEEEGAMIVTVDSHFKHYNNAKIL